VRLFIEVYILVDGGERSVIVAPILVYFNIVDDALEAHGHAFRISANDKTFRCHANWHSLRLLHDPHKEYDSLFYLNEGEMVNKAGQKIPGASYCRLPKPTALRSRAGYFCDLGPANKSSEADGNHNAQVPVTYFEIVRASDDLCAEFLNVIKPAFNRFMCRHRLSCPGEFAFAKFVDNHGLSVVTGVTKESGPIINRAAREMTGNGS
jgi:hypothetical protein